MVPGIGLLGLAGRAPAPMVVWWSPYQDQGGKELTFTLSPAPHSRWGAANFMGATRKLLFSNTIRKVGPKGMKNTRHGKINNNKSNKRFYTCYCEHGKKKSDFSPTLGLAAKILADEGVIFRP